MDERTELLGEIGAAVARPAPSYPIGSVDNTLRILLLLRDRGALALADVAEELGIARSSAHRLMAMLTYYDFVRQDPADRRFRVGAALVDIGLSAARALDVRGLARPILTGLAETTGMTAHLVLPRGRDVLFADGVESRRTIRAALRTGITLPAHVSSAGKALLATMPDELLRRLYANQPLETPTGRSISTIPALLQEVARIREAGYSINRGESEAGVLAMGVACSVPEADLLAGLAVSGPDGTFRGAWEAETAHRLRTAADTLIRQVTTHSF